MTDYTLNKHDSMDYIYDLIETCIENNEFNRLNTIFRIVYNVAHMYPVDALLAFAKATLPVKSKISFRPYFMAKCHKLYPFPNENLWKGLD